MQSRAFNFTISTLFQVFLSCRWAINAELISVSP